jgi:hypothetical protein
MTGSEAMEVNTLQARNVLKAAEEIIYSASSPALSALRLQ